MRLFWRIFLRIINKRITVTELRENKVYMIVIARDAEIDIERLDNYLREIGIRAILFRSNYVEGIKIL